MRYTIFIINILFLSIVGCAFQDARLNVMYAEENARKGPLSNINSINIEVGEFIDKRPEIDKVGYVRNGLGAKTASIVTIKPVPQIVREAIVSEFQKNGHIINPDNNDFIINGIITSFWFDLQMNFWTVEFMGTVNVDVNVVNGKTGNLLLTRTYQGHYNEKSSGGYKATWERVMNTALERMVQQMSTDSKLIQTLTDTSNTVQSEESEPMIQNEESDNMLGGIIGGVK